MAALERFALQGIASTTIQDIAEHSHTSKANVLYHFHSKENLIGEALAPCLQALEVVLRDAETSGLSGPLAQAHFVERFVAFLIHHRLAIHTVVTHPYSVGSVPSLAAAQQLMGRMAELVTSHMDGQYDRLRFGVAVSGATYALVSAGILGVEELEDDALGELLTDVLVSMLRTDKEPVN
jgi:TetR/AcrR family transcriptional regulator